MAQSYRLQWDRQIRSDTGRSERIRFRRGGGGWTEVGSIDELPEDIRQAFERFHGMADSVGADDPAFAADDLARSEFTVKRTGIPLPRAGRRRPTRAREIDRTLHLDHPWFDGFTLGAIAIAAPYIAYQAWQGLDDGGAMSISSGAMLALAAVLAYYGLCLLVNSTEFHVDDNWLTVRHGPLPWPGARRIPSDRITQLSTRVHRSRHSLSFSVTASVLGSFPVQLVEGITTFAEARSIERAIERHLGIPDEDGP